MRRILCVDDTISKAMPKPIAVGLVLITLSLASGCLWVPLPSDTPAEYTKTVKSIDAMIGSTSYDIVESIGLPDRIVRREGRTYYLYQWSSDANVMLLSLPPIFDTEEAAEIHCLLLEFGDDNRLKRYRKTSAGLDLLGGDPGSCLAVLKVRPATPIYMLREYDRNSLKWLCRAADQGLYEAKAKLASMYENGVGGVKQNRVYAYVWYRRIAEFYPDCQRVKRDLTEQELLDAERLLKRWPADVCEREFVPANAGD